MVYPDSFMRYHREIPEPLAGQIEIARRNNRARYIPDDGASPLKLPPGAVASLYRDLALFYEGTLDLLTDWDYFERRHRRTIEALYRVASDAYARSCDRER